MRDLSSFPGCVSFAVLVSFLSYPFFAPLFLHWVLRFVILLEIVYGKAKSERRGKRAYARKKTGALFFCDMQVLGPP